MDTIEITGEIINRKLAWTPREKLSLIAEAVMQEFTPNDPEKIESFWDLYSYLNREKEEVLKKLLASDNEGRQILWKQMDEIKSDITMLEIFLEVHIPIQDKP